MKLLSFKSCMHKVRNRAKEKRTSINHRHQKLVRSAFCQFWSHFSKGETISTLVIFVSCCFLPSLIPKISFYFFIFFCFFLISKKKIVSSKQLQLQIFLLGQIFELLNFLYMYELRKIAIM